MGTLIESILGASLLIALMLHWVHVSDAMASIEAGLDCQSRAMVAYQLLTHAMDEASSAHCQQMNRVLWLEGREQGGGKLGLRSATCKMIWYDVKAQRRGKDLMRSLYRQQVDGEPQAMVPGVLLMDRELGSADEIGAIKLLLSSRRHSRCFVLKIPIEWGKQDAHG